jgi:hypothetical protein
MRVPRELLLRASAGRPLTAKEQEALHNPGAVPLTAPVFWKSAGRMKGGKTQGPAR